MKRMLIAIAALVGIEAAALACSCLATDDPAELRRLAAEAATDAVALVEVEALSSYEATRTGEEMRVLRTVAGTAPGRFRIERGQFPSSASCDVLYREGERALVILYPATSGGGTLPTYRTSGLCTVHLLEKPVFRDALAAAIGTAPTPTGERG